jgi:hypothetical protein
MLRDAYQTLFPKKNLPAESHDSFGNNEIMKGRTCLDFVQGN